MSASRDMHETPDASAIIALALAEDLGVAVGAFAPGSPGDPGLLERDVTSAAVLPAGATFAGRLVAREACVACGLAVVEAVYATLSRAAGLAEPVEVFPLVAEGAHVDPGTAVAEVSGDARAVLAGERAALNLLMTLSGIATESRRWRDAAAGRLVVTDTRKTPPGLRALAKHAVRVGGSANHREGLWDMVLIKDNHIRRAGGIAAAVDAARAGHADLLVQVEADTSAQAAEAASAGADLVLLDNMDDAALREAVDAVRRAAEGRVVLTEASGGITIDRLDALAATGVDRVSTSALTLARPVDFGFDDADA